MISDFTFLDEDELKQLYKKTQNDNQKVILWGMGTTVDPILNTLCDLNIDFDYWGNGKPLGVNNTDGKKVLSYEDIPKHTNDIILIGSFGYVPIIKKLRKLGAENIYGIKEVFKYPLAELIDEKKMLDACIKKRGTSERVLLELYGNIGDVLARLGIVKYFFREYGKDNVFLLFGNEQYAEIYRNITDNVIVLEEGKQQNIGKRLKTLFQISELEFKVSYVLCDTKIYAQRRVLNRYIFSAPTVIISECLPEQEYLAGLDIDNIKKMFNLDDSCKLTAWGTLNRDDLQNVSVDEVIEEKYVAISLGASKMTRQYSPFEFLAVCEYLVERGYDIALFGKGKDDERIAEIIGAHKIIAGRIHNYVSKLSLSQTAKLMLEADFYVGTESGVWNLSYTLGIPSLVIYGGGDYGSFYHRDGLIKYLSVEKMECFYCKWFCDKTDKNGVAKCIYEITPKQIIKGIEELLKISEK